MPEVESFMNTNINNKIINLFYLVIIYMYIVLLHKSVYEQKKQIFLKNNVIKETKNQNFSQNFSLKKLKGKGRKNLQNFSFKK